MGWVGGINYMYIKKHSRVTEGYKKMIFGLVAATVVLVVFILYFSASRAVVKVVPIATQVETDFVYDVITDGGQASDQILQGVLHETEVEGIGTGEATGSEILEGDTIGQVVLINNRDEAQTLVKTTRLLTQDGILLHLSDRAEIPAKGELVADVYADDPNSFTEIQPTTFTIPGLWEGLQSQVYAENKKVISTSGETIKVVKSIDIVKAKESLTETLYEKAIKDFESQLPNSNYVTLVVSKQVIEEAVDVEEGAKQDEFEVSLKITAILIGLDQNKIIEVAGDRLQQAVPDGQDLLSLSVEKLSYKVQDFNDQNKTAKIRVHVEGDSVIKANNEIFAKDKMVGLSPKGVELYLASFDEVESVIVELSPFWVKKVPKLKDHVNIVIVNPNK
jgi:hypothetical protein